MAKHTGTGNAGAQARMRGMKTRTRASTPKTTNMQQQTSARNRAQARMWDEGKKQLDAEFQREGNRHKFSTRRDVEARARRDYDAGKIKRGELTKTIERRWKAAQKRRDKFTSTQKEKRAEAEKALRERVKNASNAELGLKTVTAVVTWQDSSDTRETVLQFPATGDTMRADAGEALAAYRMSDSVSLISAKPLSWDDL